VLEKLKWNVLHKQTFNEREDFLETILATDGIEDIPAFLNPPKSACHDPFLMKNMRRGVELLHNVLDGEGAAIYLQVDSDVDGFTSAAYMKQFIQDVDPTARVDCYLHYAKEHGLVLEEADERILTEYYGLVIVPDAGSDEAEVHTTLGYRYGIPILVLDHHQIAENQEEYWTCLINCQDGQYPNRTLSGVGVVQKFVEAFAQTYPELNIDTEKYMDLVALGNIADVMDLRNLETRYYVLHGLDEEHRHNLLISEMAERFHNDMKLGHTIKNYGWVIAPKINGCIRYGTQAEQNDLFKALSGEKRDSLYQPRRRSTDDTIPPIEIHSLQKTMARICANVKSRQDKAVRSGMESLIDRIRQQHLDAHSILVVDSTGVDMKSTVTGLVANKLVSKYRRPVLVIHPDNEGFLRGSARGYTYGPIQSLRKTLLETGLFTMCAGHDNSFGVTLPANNLPALLDYFDERYPLSSLQTVYTVDYEVKGMRLRPKDVERVANNYAVWGNQTVPEPLFAVTDIYIDAKDIHSCGESGLYIRFTYNGVDYIKKYCRSTEYNDITLRDRHVMGENRKHLKLTVLGNFSLNEWEGERYPQVVIQHWYSEEVTANTTLDDDDDDFIF
jgi:single-stranded-DNA-specific exonuclease